MRRTIMGLLVLLVSAAAGICCLRGLEKNAAGELGLVYLEESVTRARMETWWENADARKRDYIRNITLSRKQEKIEIRNKKTGAGTEILLIEAAGDMNLILPGRLCEGSLAGSEDRKGCVVSKGLAQKLNMTGTGDILICRNQEYVIRGILDISDKICIVQGTDDRIYTRVQIKYEKMPASGLIQMLAGLLPGEADIKAEGDLYRGLGGFFLLMPLCTLFVLLMKAFHRFYRKEGRNAWIREGCSILFPVLVLGGVFLLAFWGLRFSDDYIPGAWSDFAFWPKLFQEKVQDIRKLIINQLDCRDRKMLLETAGCLLWGGIGSAAVFLSFGKTIKLFLKKLSKY